MDARMTATASQARPAGKLGAKLGRLRQDFTMNRELYLLLVPVILYFLLFHYQPMYGAQIAFKRLQSRTRGSGKPVGRLPALQRFFQQLLFLALHPQHAPDQRLRSCCSGFPAPIILALLLNEVSNVAFKRTVQTITYLPHFISIVVVCGIIVDFLRRDGLINQLHRRSSADKPVPFMLKPEWFRTIYVASGIWQRIGWGSIVYLAALSAPSIPELYEAATIDGAGRLRADPVRHASRASRRPSSSCSSCGMGRMMNVGVGEDPPSVQPETYETADVISTFVYRKGFSR